MGMNSRVCSSPNLRPWTAVAVPWLVSLLAVGALSFLTSCASDPALKGSRLVVTANNAQFYKDGPAQDFDYPQPTFAVYQTELASGPDFKLPRGTTLTLLKRELGYSHVMTEAGVAGYVANDQVAFAPGVARSAAALDVPASSTISSTRAVSRKTRAHPAAPMKERDQELDLHDLPLPQPG